MFFLASLAIFALFHISSPAALPADNTANFLQGTDVAQNGAQPPPPPAECTVIVGTADRKLKEGCQLCWSPPEYITCKNRDWDFGTCGSDMKCVHTGECATTCVPKPPTTKRPPTTTPITPAPSPPTPGVVAGPSA